MAAIAAQNSGTVKNSSVSAAITAESEAGSIAGQNSGTVSACMANGTINAKAGAGLIAGQTTGGSISACFAKGKVTVSEQNAGGIVGQASGGSVRYNISQASFVQAGQNAGGVAGLASAGATVSQNLCLVDVINGVNRAAFAVRQALPLAKTFPLAEPCC